MQYRRLRGPVTGTPSLRRLARASRPLTAWWIPRALYSRFPTAYRSVPCPSPHSTLPVRRLPPFAAIHVAHRTQCRRPAGGDSYPCVSRVRMHRRRIPCPDVRMAWPQTRPQPSQSDMVRRRPIPNTILRCSPTTEAAKSSSRTHEGSWCGTDEMRVRKDLS